MRITQNIKEQNTTAWNSNGTSQISYYSRLIYFSLSFFIRRCALFVVLFVGPVLFTFFIWIEMYVQTKSSINNLRSDEQNLRSIEAFFVWTNIFVSFERTSFPHVIFSHVCPFKSLEERFDHYRAQTNIIFYYRPIQSYSLGFWPKYTFFTTLRETEISWLLEVFYAFPCSQKMRRISRWRHDRVWRRRWTLIRSSGSRGLLGWGCVDPSGRDQDPTRRSWSIIARK